MGGKLHETKAFYDSFSDRFVCICAVLVCCTLHTCVNFTVWAATGVQDGKISADSL